MISKIIVCRSCNGTGKTQQRECTDYHHNHFDDWDEPCVFCDGHGRMVEEVYVRKLTKDELALTPKPKEKQNG